MGVIFELLFSIFQVVAGSSNKESKANKYVAVGFFVVLLLVVVLIWWYNPAPHTTGAKTF
jgi:cytochrome b